MKRLIAVALLLSAGLAHATPMDVSLFNTTGVVESNAGVYTLDGSHLAVESLYLEDFWIDSSFQSLTFDMLFHSGQGFDFGTNVLAFRLFTDGNWEDLWVGRSDNDLWSVFEPDFGVITGAVSIDMTPYQNSFVAMGWSFVSDGFEFSQAQISNIQAVSEPSSLALILLVAAGFVFSRRYWRFTAQTPASVITS